MKYSKKYLKRLKKRILGCISSIAICLVLIAGSKLAGLSMPISSLDPFSITKINGDKTTVEADIAYTRRRSNYG